MFVKKDSSFRPAGGGVSYRVNDYVSRVMIIGKCNQGEQKNRARLMYYQPVPRLFSLRYLSGLARFPDLIENMESIVALRLVQGKWRIRRMNVKEFIVQTELL